MINEEKQHGTLYHSTELRNLYKILTSNKLVYSRATTVENKFHSKNNYYISLGRSPEKYDEDTESTISLDMTKITNNHKVQPFRWKKIQPNWRAENEDESEERIWSTKIERKKQVPALENTNSFIKAITLNTNFVTATDEPYIKKVEVLAKRLKIPISIKGNLSVDKATVTKSRLKRKKDAMKKRLDKS